MGIWGVKIEQNDTFCEAVESFQKRISDGLQPRAAYNCIYQTHKDEPDFYMVLFALTECLWRYNQLTAEDLSKATHQDILTADALYWSTNCESEDLRQKHRLELQRFLQRLERQPTGAEIWIPPSKPDVVEAGTVFWYRMNQKIYGAVILGIGADHFYFVALSEALPQIPQNVEDILEAPLYTAAWFGGESMLGTRRMHFVGQVEVEGEYNGRAGFLYEENSQLLNHNVGQSATWKHIFRSFKKGDSQVKETLRPSFFPKVWSCMQRN